MYSFQAAQSTTPSQPVNQRAFQRVAVNVDGRLMLANHEEYVCTVIDMSPGDVTFECVARPAEN